MHFRILTTTLLPLILIICSVQSSASQTYELVWQDEFDGTSVDPAKWSFQTGNGCPTLCGWGNNELQYYRAENATVAGGLLTITAKEEAFGGADYTSARLRTAFLGDWKHGRFEMRAKLPIGQGLWPAFWMLPTTEAYGGWAASGEIDIMEYIGSDPDRVFGTLHYGGSFPGNVFSSNSFTLGAGTFHDDFHEFALEWDECEMRWYVDGALYATQKDWYSEGGPYPAPFDEPFYLLLNLAVGGNLPGPPDGTTMFPQELVVDYIRVYQIPGIDRSPCLALFDGMEHANPLGNNWFSFGGDVGGGGINANTSDLPPIDGCRASIETGWGSGGTPGFFGGFGRTNPLDLSDATHFSFWINPDANQDYTLEINLQDDDNGDNVIPATPDGADDEFDYSITVSPTGPDVIAGGGWQRVTIPLSDFTDDNSYHFGGNGIFDPTPLSEGGNGQLVNVVVTIVSNSGASVSFRTDYWIFTRQTGQIAGRIWEDSDGNGLQNGAETGIEDVTVELVDPDLGAVIGSTISDLSGDYVFDELLGGTYEVRVDPASLPGEVIATFDPDGVATEDTYLQDLECDAIEPNGDFGYLLATSSVPGVVASNDFSLRSSPNPFHRSTVIEFELPRASNIALTIHDASGRRIAQPFAGKLEAGPHTVLWKGRDDRGREVPGGIYFYKLDTDRGAQIQRLSVVR